MGLAGSQGLKSGGGTATSLAPGATGTNLALSGDATALRFVSTQASGSDGLKFNTTGARAHLGAGTADYIASDGTGLVLGAYLIVPTNQGIYFDTGGTKRIVWDGTNIATNAPFAFGTSVVFSSFSDDSANPGNRTVNTVRGKSAIALGASSAVITNSFCALTSTVLAVLEANDATATFIKSVVPSGTGFTITVNANATANLKFSWVVLN